MKYLSKNSSYFLKIIGIIFLIFPGCLGQSNNLVTVSKPEFNKEEIKKIGIIKFKNQSIDPNAGLKVADIFYKELTSYRQFELVAPAEMSHKGYKMEFVKTPEDIPGLPSPVDKIKNSEIYPERKSHK